MVPGAATIGDSGDECDGANLLQGCQDAQERTGAGVIASGDGNSRPNLTRGQLFRIATGMLGLMFGWATKTVLTTPLFRDVYGVDPADIGFVWLAGPLSGLVVQPVVGVISDHREGQDKRSFFLAIGTVVMAASLAVLPVAGAVCERLSRGRHHHQQQEQRQEIQANDGESDTTNGAWFAVCALWALDLAMNASLVAIRAVIADCAPPRQQPEANTVILVSYGAGTLLGYGFGAVDAASWLGLPPGAFWKSCVDFWVAAVVLLVASGVATTEAFRLERPRATAPSRRRAPSSYTALRRREDREQQWWLQQHCRQSSGSGIGSGGDVGFGVGPGVGPGVVAIVGHVDSRGGGSSGSGGCASTKNIGAMSPSSVNAGTAATDRNSRSSDVSNGGEGSGVCTGHTGEEGASRGKEDQDRRWRKPPATDCVTDERYLGDGFPVVPCQLGGARGGDANGARDDCSVREDPFYEESGIAGATATAAGGVSPALSQLSDMTLFYSVPAWLLPVCLLVFHSWVGWFAIIIFGSDWVGVNVFDGDPSAESGDERRQAYEDGVVWASAGLAAQAFVVTIMGVGPATRLVRYTGFRGAFFTGVLFQSACLLCAALLRPNAAGRVLSLVVFSALGVPLALVETLPYMMVGMFSPHDKHGQLLGKLNVWIVLAQLALTLCVHPIVKHSRDGDAPVLLAGAAAAALGVVFVPMIGRDGTAAVPSKARRNAGEALSSPFRGLLDQGG